MHALSLPRWIAERWLSDYGADAAAALARACNLAPPHTIRTNRKRTDRDELLAKLRPRFPEARACHLAPHGIVLGRKGDPGRDPHFRAGNYTVQDEASQLVTELLAVAPDDHVLDVCAAPGTKTTAIAEALGENGWVLALDRNASRLNLVARNARRLELSGISTLLRDATGSLNNLPEAPGKPASADGTRFDRILVDAPCSGLGALRRNPDARWRIRPADLPQLANLQATILAQAAEALRPDGVLVYSTCTVLREENEDVVQRFLASHPEFRLAPKQDLPAAVAPVLDDEGYLRCFPHLHDTDGFFAARLERRG